jgi:hypothetical protein
VEFPGSLDIYLRLPMTETASATLARQRKHRGKKQKTKKVSECMIASLSFEP